jgi:hypothetical protein
MTSHTDGRSMIFIAVIIFVIFGWSISAALHVQKAIATERATTAVRKINDPAMSQSPLYTEADNISNRKPAVVNGITTTNATEILFSGYGTYLPLVSLAFCILPIMASN